MPYNQSHPEVNLFVAALGVVPGESFENLDGTLLSKAVNADARMEIITMAETVYPSHNS